MIKTTDIYWLAGLIEGEGSFMYNKSTPTIAMQMTDPDVIERARVVLGANVRSPWRSKLGNRKLVYVVAVNGRKALGWMMVLYSLMGERRQEAIRKVLDKWKAQPRSTHASRGQRTMAVCHPDQPVAGGMLCKKCYMREWRAKRKAS